MALRSKKSPRDNESEERDWLERDWLERDWLERLRILTYWLKFMCKAYSKD
jgi:hypothetical protein